MTRERTSPRRATPRGDWWKKLALLATTALITLLLGECTMHALDIGQPRLYEVDDTFGHAPIPGAEGMFRREGSAHVRITEHGYRGVSHGRERTPDTFRLVVLGDSYTEARQVALDETFSARLQDSLGACPALEGRTPEVLNFGVSGYGTSIEYLTLRERALRYAPDAVLLAFLTGNDISDNHAALRHGDVPHFTLEDGELVLDERFRESPRFRARREGGALQWVRQNSRIYQIGNLIWGTSQAREQAGELGLHDAIYAPPATPEWVDAWRVTEALLARMHDELAADARPFFVVTLSNAIQVDPDAARREAYRVQIGAEDLEYPDRRITEAGARDGYPVLSLVPPLRAHAEAHDVYLHGFENTEMGTGHWNATGHRVASEAMASWLCERLSNP